MNKPTELSLTEIKNLRLINAKMIIIGRLNDNFLPHKFDQLKEILLKYVDILGFTKRQQDDTFQTSMF